MTPCPRIAILVLLCTLVAACGGDRNDQRDMLATDLGAGVRVPPPPPAPPPLPEAATGRINLDTHLGIHRHFKALDFWLFKEQPTTPDSIERLLERIEDLMTEVKRGVPDEDPCVRAVHSLERLRFQVIQGLVVWTAQRTLVTYRLEWEEIRRRHFWSGDEAMQVASPDLDRAQSVRNPDREIDLVMNLKVGENMYHRIDNLLGALERLPKDERFQHFSDTTFRWQTELSPWYNTPYLRLTKRSPLVVRRGWTEVAITKGEVFGLLTQPWLQEFLAIGDRVVPQELARLKETYASLDEYR